LTRYVWSCFDLEVGRYLDINLPERFVLETLTERGTWLEYGVYFAKDWKRFNDGSYGCGGLGWSPTYIRCVAHYGDHFEHVDGTGKHFRYRIRSVPMPRNPDGTVRSG